LLALQSSSIKVEETKVDQSPVEQQDMGMSRMMEGEEGIKGDKHMRGPEDPRMCKKMSVKESSMSPLDKHKGEPEDYGMNKMMKLGEEDTKVGRDMRGSEGPGMSKKMRVREEGIKVDKSRKILEGQGTERKLKVREGGCGLQGVLISTTTLPQVAPSPVSSLSKLKKLATNS